MVIVMVVVVLVEVVMCIVGEWNLCWFHSRIRIPMMTESR